MAKKQVPPFLAPAFAEAKTGPARAQAALMALRQAASQGRVEDLLSAKAWMSPSRFGPILVAAVAAGQVECARALLAISGEFGQAGADAVRDGARQAALDRHLELTLLFIRHAPWTANFVIQCAMSESKWFESGAQSADLAGALFEISPNLCRQCLTDAATQRKLAVVELFLSVGALPEPGALVAAASGGDPECVKRLLPWFDPQADHSAPLRAAAAAARHACLELLIPLSNPDDFEQALDEALPGPHPKRAAATQAILRAAMAEREKAMLALETAPAPARKAPRM